jgi:hypothetical protein
MKRQSESKSEPRQAGAKIPDKPRDCGPHVDTWPILDTQVGDAPKPRTDEYGTPKPKGQS